MPRSIRKQPRFIDPEGQFEKFTKSTDDFSATVVYKYAKDLVSVQFSEILKLQKKELDSSTFYHHAWNEAKNGFKRISSNLPDACQIAIIAYTLPTPLYTDFNTKCRTFKTDDDWKVFPYKSLYALLARSIHGIKNNPELTHKTYYRGMPSEVTSLKKGEFIFAAQFLSTSIDQEVALGFMSDSSHPTMIVIKGFPLAACGIEDYTKVPGEQEVLFLPWNKFQVSNIVKNKTFTTEDDEEIVADEVTLTVIESFVRELPYSGQYKNRGIVINNK